MTAEPEEGGALAAEAGGEMGGKAHLAPSSAAFSGANQRVDCGFHEFEAKFKEHGVIVEDADRDRQGTKVIDRRSGGSVPGAQNEAISIGGSVEKEEVNAHADSDDGEQRGQGDRFDGDLAGSPGAGAELLGGADVVRDSGDKDDDA